MKMGEYEITITLGERQDSEVKLIVTANNSESANDLADVLASLMPVKNVYSSKQEQYIDAYWYGSAEPKLPRTEVK